MSAVSYRAVGWRALIALVAGVVLTAGMAQTHAGHAILLKTGLFEQPTSYTSLAFLNPQSLPEQLPSKRANVRVSFKIDNATGVPRDYKWSVRLLQGQRTHHVAAGTVRLASGRGAAITQSAKILCTRGRVQVVVSLTHPAESIDAWATCWSRRG